MNEATETLLSEHLEELRKTLLIMLGIGLLTFTLTFFWHKPLFETLNQPYRAKLTAFEKTLKKKLHFFEYKNFTSTPVSLNLDSSEVIVESPSYFQKENAVLQPGDRLIVSAYPSATLLILQPVEGFLLAIKLSLYSSLVLSSPMWLFLIARFISPALTSIEKKVLRLFFVPSILLLALGLYIGYTQLLPLCLNYLFNFNLSFGQNAWTATEYVDFCLSLLFGAVICLELTFLLFSSVHYQLLSLEHLIKGRPYFIVLAFILGAIFTPPDILSQFCLAIPLIAFFELMVGYSYYLHQKNKEISTSSV